MSRLPKLIGSASQGGQEAVERSRLCVTLLSREWRSSIDGDLSTVNRELATQLAKHPGVQVSVFLPQCSEDDKRIAANHKVQLFEAEEMTGVDPVDWLINIPEDHAMDCIIGHGVHLGRQIPVIQRSHQCKWIQIVHNAPETLAIYKSNADAIPRGEKMQQTEIELCELADEVVAIGPKLADTYRRFLRSSKKHQDVIDLTPSIFTEFLDVKQAAEERQTFCVLVIGSGDSEDFTLKGYGLAAQAIAELKEKSYQLKFVCPPTGKGDEIAEKLLEHGIDRSQLTVRSFNESRETLARLFCEVDLAIMPSRSEGFGLTALEALSAGLPVLVSDTSGLGEALVKVPYGSNCVVDSEDPKHWASKIKAVREKDRDVRLTESKLLREKYLEKYSWEKPCGVLVEKMQNLVTGCQLFMGHAVDHNLLSLVQQDVKKLVMVYKTTEKSLSQQRVELTTMQNTGTSSQDQQSATRVQLEERDKHLTAVLEWTEQEMKEKIKEILRKLLSEEELLIRVEKVEKGLAETDDKVEQLDQGFAKTDATVGQLEQGFAKTDAAVGQLEKGFAKTDATVGQLEKGFAKTNATVRQLERGFATTNATVGQLERGFAQANPTLGQLEQGFAKTDATVGQLERGFATTNATVGQLEQGFAKTNATVRQLERGFAKTDATVGQLEQGFAKTNATVKQLERGFAKTDATVGQLEQGFAKADAIVGQLEQGFAKSNATVGQLEKGFAQTNATVGQLEQGFAKSNATVRQLEQGFAKTDATVGQLEQGFAKTDATVGQLEQGFSKIDATVAQLEQGFAKSNATVGQLEKGFAKTDVKVEKLEQRIAKTDARVEQLEQGFVRIEKDASETGSKVKKQLEKPVLSLSTKENNSAMFMAGGYSQLPFHTATQTHGEPSYPRSHHPQRPAVKRKSELPGSSCVKHPKLTRAVKEGSPENIDLERLANRIMNEWRKLGRRLLESDEALLDAVDMENKIYSEKAYKMLLLWKAAEGSDAAFRVLHDALCHDIVNRRDLAEIFCLVTDD